MSLPHKSKIASIALGAVLISALAGCNKNDHHYSGYIENDLTYISSPQSGQLTSIPIERGQAIQKGQLLFTLDQLPEKADMLTAQANVEQALHSLKDLQTGARPTELDEIRAQIESAKANIDFYALQKERRGELVQSKLMDDESLDETIQSLKVSQSNLAQYQASLATAQLPSRIEQIKAAQAGLVAAQGSLKKAKWMLNQKTVTAPLSAKIFDSFYYPGEQVPAFSPVVALIDTDENYGIFFIPESKLSQVKIGQKVEINCDGCASDIKGDISYISPEAEYTPPVIFSNEQRSKLVYRLEVGFDAKTSETLHPGQPIDVTL